MNEDFGNNFERENNNTADDVSFKATEEIKRKSLASVELMQEINGFVNADLMNP